MIFEQKIQAVHGLGGGGKNSMTNLSQQPSLLSVSKHWIFLPAKEKEYAKSSCVFTLHYLWVLGKPSQPFKKKHREIHLPLPPKY